MIKHIKTFVLSNLYAIIFMVTSIVIPYFCVNSYDYKVDKICQEINDYNKHNYYTDFTPSILNVKNTTQESDSELLYHDAFEAFYYNLLVKGSRLLVDNYCNDGDDSIKLLTQRTFSIQETESTTGGGYRLDYGLYHTYFSNKDLGMSNCYTPRFDCDTFILVSDTYADKIVTKFDISGANKKEQYKTLLLNEKFSKILLRIDDEIFSFSINNILYTSSREGPRTDELYGNFGLVSIHSKPGKKFVTSFEVDLKVDPYGNKNTIKTLRELGYKNNRSNYLLSSYDYNLKKYIVNNELTMKINNIKDGTLYDTLFLVFSIILCLISFLTLIHFKNPMKDYLSVILWLTILTILLVYFTICTWITTYSFISLPFIIQGCLIVFFKGKEFIGFVKKRKFTSQNNTKRNIEYTEIKI